MITVSIASAMLCVAEACFPVLVGAQTPVGEFTLAHRPTRQLGYGGDVLLFHEDARYAYAIHRTWRGREGLYATPNRHITKGCINVEPAVYEFLVHCCNGQKLVVQ